MENEIWKTIKLLDEYEISNKGRVRRSKPVKKWNGHGWYFLPTNNLAVTKTKSGYLVVNIQCKVRYIHRLVAASFLPDSPFYGMDVNHKDGNKENNIPINLEWCNRKHNINHAFDTGLMRIKEKHHSAKYSDELVNEIIEISHRTGLKAKKLRDLYYPNIPRTTISSFINQYRRKGRAGI